MRKPALIDSPFRPYEKYHPPLPSSVTWVMPLKVTHVCIWCNESRRNYRYAIGWRFGDDGMLNIRKFPIEFSWNDRSFSIVKKNWGSKQFDWCMDKLWIPVRWIKRTNEESKEKQLYGRSVCSFSGHFIINRSQKKFSRFPFTWQLLVPYFSD